MRGEEGGVRGRRGKGEGEKREVRGEKREGERGIGAYTTTLTMSL